MHKVPVVATLRATYGFVFHNYLRILGVVWVPMALIFFFAQYGLREVDWYLMGGIAGALYNLTKAASAKEGGDTVEPSAPSKLLFRPNGKLPIRKLGSGTAPKRSA